MNTSPFAYKDIYNIVDAVFEGEVHAKRVESISNATLGVMNAAALGLRGIGNGLAQAKGLNPKHAIKQVDRLLSNKKFDVNNYFESWVPYHLGERLNIVVAMDWTEFDQDDHSTLAINL